MRSRPNIAVTLIRWVAVCVLLLLPAVWTSAEEKPAAELNNSAIANAEMAAMQTALDLFELEYGYYVSLETLDDIDVNPTTPQHDYVFNSPGLRVLRPNKGFFEPTPLLTLPSPPYNGPYATYQPGTTQVGSIPYDEGSPLDPWNRPYLLYSPLGLVRGDTGGITNEYHGDIFDRWAIVSLGADGQPDTVTSPDDDIIRLFSSGLSASAISIIAGPLVTQQHLGYATLFSVPAGSTVSIHGYNLGATQGTSQIHYGASPLACTITLWSATLITLNLDPSVSGFQNLTVRVGPIATPAITNALPFHIRANAAHDWTEFE